MVILQGVRHALWHRHRLLADARLLRLDDAAHARALRARRSLVNRRGVSARERGRVRGEHHRSGRSCSGRGLPSGAPSARQRQRARHIYFFYTGGWLVTHPGAHPYYVPSHTGRNSHPDGFKWVLNSECARPSGSRPRTKRHFADERTNERRDERRDGRRDGRTGLSSVDERDDDDDGEGDDTDEGVGDAPDAGRGGTECVTSRAPAVRENDGSSRRGAAW